MDGTPHQKLQQHTSQRRTNVQQLTCKMVWSFSSLTEKKALILREVLGEKF